MGSQLKAAHMRLFAAGTLGFALMSSSALVCVGRASAQTGQGQSSDPSGLLAEIDSAFATSGTAVNSVRLSGDAIWYAGDTVDSGTATLTGSIDGTAEMQLALGSKGSWVESQTAIGAGMRCSWEGNDQVQHYGDFANCLHSTVWFLPTLSLQSSALPPGTALADLGTGAVGPGTYRHLQAQLLVSSLPADVQSRAATTRITDIGFDPQTYLPAALTYQVFSDLGGTTANSIEVLFSNFQQVNGIQIPFLIQRYINGSLQLTITVTDAQVN